MALADFGEEAGRVVRVEVRSDAPLLGARAAPRVAQGGGARQGDRGGAADHRVRRPGVRRPIHLPARQSGQRSADHRRHRGGGRDRQRRGGCRHHADRRVAGADRGGAGCGPPGGGPERAGPGGPAASRRPDEPGRRAGRRAEPAARARGRPTGQRTRGAGGADQPSRVGPPGRDHRGADDAGLAGVRPVSAPGARPGAAARQAGSLRDGGGRHRARPCHPRRTRRPAAAPAPKRGGSRPRVAGGAAARGQAIRGPAGALCRPGTEQRGHPHPGRRARDRSSRHSRQGQAGRGGRTRGGGADRRPAAQGAWPPRIQHGGTGQQRVRARGRHRRRADAGPRPSAARSKSPVRRARARPSRCGCRSPSPSCGC